MKLKDHFLVFGISLLFIACNSQVEIKKSIYELEKERVLFFADKYLIEEVETITSVNCERSAGGIHDFYSEGDYWWPDTTNLSGPYLRRDGLTNPDNFTAHRILLRKLSFIVPGLVAAYKLTDEAYYAQKAIDHLNAWFVNEHSKMSSNMLYSQAIYGRVTGRGIGIIDAIHLVEVVKATMILEEAGIFEKDDLHEIKVWFEEFSHWITTHPYGIAEKNNGNNHTTCWAMQVAMFSHFTGNDSLLSTCVDFYKNNLLPEQMAENGSFPKEMSRTKPYGYSLFNLDAMYTLLHILAINEPDIWTFTADKLNIKNAVDFMYPFIEDKTQWPLAPDVMYFEDWPMRHPSLLFAYMAYGESKYFDLWKTLKADSNKNEIQRNFFIRQPILWLE